MLVYVLIVPGKRKSHREFRKSLLNIRIWGSDWCVARENRFADEFQHVHMNENEPVLFRCYWVTFFMQQAVTCLSFFSPTWYTGGSPVLAPKTNAAPSDKGSVPLKINLLQFRKNVSDLRMQLHQMRQLQARTLFSFLMHFECVC